MTPSQGFAALVVGFISVVAGLVWLFGPWSLVGSGLVVVALALLVPVKERSAEPVDEAVPPGS